MPRSSYQEAYMGGHVCMKTILMLFLALPLLHAQEFITPEDKFLTCTKDSQCKASPNDCAQCCSQGIAVNQKYFREFQQLVRKSCEQYQRSKCNCIAAENWIPSCVAGKCVMLSEKAEDQHRDCLKRGGSWQGTTRGRGRLTGCNMPTKDGGKPCSRGEDCESVCLRDGKCHGWMMYKGCAHFKGHERAMCVD